MERLRWETHLLALRPVVVPSVVGAADYVGSDKCGMCRRDICDNRKIRPHNQFQK